MPKTKKRLKTIRDPFVVLMLGEGITAEDVAELFNISTQAVYDISKRHKVQVEDETNN